MDLKRTLARLTAIQTVMSDAGLRDPDAKFEISPNKGEQAVALYYVGYDFKVARFDTVDELEAWANALPTKDEAEKRQFVEDLGALAERGRSIDGVDAEALSAMHKTVYHNLLLPPA